MDLEVGRIPLQDEAVRAIERAGDGLRSGADAVASEARAAWAARPLGPGGVGNLRRWLGFLAYRLALRRNPEIGERP